MAFGGKQFHCSMSCDHELANEKTRCSGKNASYITISVVFAHAHIVLLTTQKSRRAVRKFHNARSLQENNALSAANQSARTIVAI